VSSALGLARVLNLTRCASGNATSPGNLIYLWSGYRRGDPEPVRHPGNAIAKQICHHFDLVRNYLIMTNGSGCLIDNNYLYTCWIAINDANSSDQISRNRIYICSQGESSSPEIPI